MFKQYVYAYIEIFTQKIYLFCQKFKNLVGKIKADIEDYMESSLLVGGYRWLVRFKLHILRVLKNSQRYKVTVTYICDNISSQIFQFVINPLLRKNRM